MLATSFNSLLEGFSSVALGLHQIKKQPPPAQNNEFQTGIAEYDVADDEERIGISSEKERNQIHRFSGNFYNNESDSINALLGNLGQRSSANSGMPFHGNESNNNNTTGNPSLESYPSANSVSYSSLETRENTSHSFNHNLSSRTALSSSQSVPSLNRRLASNDTLAAEQAFSVNDISQPDMAKFANGLLTVLSHQQQMIDTQQVIITNLCSKLASTESRLKHLEGDGIISPSQNTCGDFYWSINNFSTHRDKALREETSILHSPAFHSSPWGYKLCLRVNVNGSLNSQGEHFVSLFIHFMQGNNDHLLNWPFMGQIVLSIVDQNPVCKERKHAMETLRARPEIAAFQKPITVRNHKGFGYTDFISLNVLDNGNYIKDDTLIIRAQVFPAQP